MEKEYLLSLIEADFRKKVKKDKKIHNAYLLVHSDKLDVHLNIAEGSTEKLAINQPYHIASIGKLFTSVLIGILYEQGKLDYYDCIAKYLDGDLLNQLHVYKGLDYTHEIKIKHLLNHTSGLHDYFSDKPKQGVAMIDYILNNPSYVWSPIEVVKWSKDNLGAHFPPGKGFHYSDTGYHILGLIIEKITGQPLSEVLQSYIFEPLQMYHSYLYGYSKPIKKLENEVAELYAKGINVMGYESLSIDYAGGGIISTNEDLLKFMKAIVDRKIVNNQTFDKMKDWAKFSIGINYGYGLMSFYSIPLVYPSQYEMWGNAGSTGSYMFYNAAMDLYIIGGLNQFGYAQKGIRSIFGILRKMEKYKNGLVK